MKIKRMKKKLKIQKMFKTKVENIQENQDQSIENQKVEEQNIKSETNE